MPRRARVAPQDHVFHALTRGNNRQDVFLDTMDYQTYLGVLKKYREKFEFKIYHYVLMKNHVHLVLETFEKGGTLAEVMKGEMSRRVIYGNIALTTKIKEEYKIEEIIRLKGRPKGERSELIK